MNTDMACAQALGGLMTAIITCDVSQKIAELMSTATLVVLLQKDEETMAILKRIMGPNYIQPQRPFGIG